MVRWLRWHCPPDTGFEIRALAVWGRARYLSVTEAPHNTNFHTWMGKKHFCFFQTAETGNRTPNSGVKGSGANHYPRAPAPRTEDVGLPIKFRFNVGPTLQPIVGSLPIDRLRRWPNTNLSSGLLYSFRKHVAFNQCCFNVDPLSSTLALKWNSIKCLYRVFWLLHYAGDALTSRRQEHQITRCIGPMLM